MDDRLTDIKKMLRTLAEEGQDDSGPHPADERLIDYYSRALPADEMTLIEDHLVVCRKCAAAVLDLAAFCAPVDESSKLSPAESDAAWARFMARVEKSSSKGPATISVSQPSWSERFMAWFVPQRVAYALGALLLALSLFLVLIYRENRILVARLEQQNTQGPTAGEVALQREVEQARKERDEERVRSEQLEIKAAELEAQIGAAQNSNRNSNDPTAVRAIGQVVPVSVQSGTRRGADEFESLEVRSGKRLFTLHVFVPGGKPNRKYAFEIKDLNEKKILTRDNLAIGPAGGLTIIVRTDALPSGQYRFSVYEVRGRATKLEGERLVDVQYK